MIGMFFVCLFALSQAAEDEIKIDYVEKVVIVNMPLLVQKDGRPYKSLQRDEVRLTENGTPIALQDLRQQEAGLTLHFLFDLSTSHSDYIYSVKRAVRDLIRKMKPEDRAKISFFSVSYQSLTDYTDDREQLLKFANFLTPIGSTALYDGITASLLELSRRKGPRALILFSDGHDLMSQVREETLSAMVKNYNIPILLVTHGRQSEELPLLAAQTQFMRELVEESGGTMVRHDQDPSKELLRALKPLRMRYILTYAPPNPESVELWRSLQVTIPGCPDCGLDYRRGYQIKNNDGTP